MKHDIYSLNNCIYLGIFEIGEKINHSKIFNISDTIFSEKTPLPSSSKCNPSASLNVTWGAIT
ncbi:MAG: hypothetical protein A3C44_00555 [Gammaproteobacteria bacterium RIFCSPHIGHO2_02_FULL_39_13]|nr:MAG: hypothetical protein A3C44_00555 [Gammaproteobacteria bacterium RIFCSPHIGHO2_02_FULL_39_13]